MTKLGEPPSSAQLGSTEPEIRVLDAGTRLWRVYFRAGRHPSTWSEFRTYGPTNARFDHQASPEPNAGQPVREVPRAIMYAALGGRACVAEVFQEKRVVDRMRRDPWLVAFDLQQPLRLLDLTGLWPTRTGKASAAIASGPRQRTRRWSRAIYEAYPSVQGLYYTSSMAPPEPCIALYERTQLAGAMPVRPEFHRGLADPSLLEALRNIAHDLGYDLV